MARLWLVALWRAIGYIALGWGVMLESPPTALSTLARK
jgi:hypothetical protein